MIKTSLYALNLTVFITGAAVLILEVTATRILSPYFGNTLYAVSSILSVVLGALSFGYYYGGKLADAKPLPSLFYSLVLVSGLSILLTKLFSTWLLPFLGPILPLDWGPLLVSFLLFAIPSFIFGLLSPFAIKLAHLQDPKTGTGSLAGKIFFWSTLGSIAGSLLAGFYLIPTLGLSKTVFFTAAVICITGILGLFSLGKTRLGLTSLLLVVVLFTSTAQIKSYSVFPGTIYEIDGLYEKISVVDRTYNNRPARFLHQDRSNSSAIYLDSPDHVFEYTKYFEVLNQVNPHPKSALILGAGAYTIPKALLEKYPDIQVDVVDIEPHLQSIAQKYFGLIPNPRLKTYTTDGRRFLSQTSTKYDIIFVDVYFSLASIPTHFTTREFFSLAKNHLSDSGLFIGNFIGQLKRLPDSLTFSSMSTFSSVFSKAFYSATQDQRTPKIQNLMFIGLPSSSPITSLTLPNPIDTSRFAISTYPLLTDDPAPTDYLTTKLLKNSTSASQKIFTGVPSLMFINQLTQFGPRDIFSSGRLQAQKLITSEFSIIADKLETQTWIHTSKSGQKFEFTNFIARFKSELEPRLILGTHYDSLKDIVGANNSASGVAIFTELAQIIGHFPLPYGVDIVLFDAEEGENSLPDYTWVPLGSTYFAKNIKDFYPDRLPQSAIIIDMVCDSDLKIYKETSSNSLLTEKIWSTATPEFINQSKYTIFDDHTPLSQIGIPSALIIDFDYPHYKGADTPDKCSSKSLKSVGTTLLNYLYSQSP